MGMLENSIKERETRFMKDFTLARFLLLSSSGCLILVFYFWFIKRVSGTRYLGSPRVHADDLVDLDVYDIVALVVHYILATPKAVNIYSRKLPCFLTLLVVVTYHVSMN